MSDLYRLVYASKNLLHGSDAEVAQAVAQILATSQRNNAKVDVTGALMFNAGAFAQVLEGPRRGVEATFERIQRDLRHGDVTVLQCGAVESRGFPNWSMAFVGQSASGQALWQGIATDSGFDLSRLDGDQVFAALHSLVLEEEGVTVVAPAAVSSDAKIAHDLGSLDVDRLRAELPLPGQVLQAAERAVPSSDSNTSARPSAASAARQTQSRVEADRTSSAAALAVFRAALVSERQLTTELRNQLDELHLTLASTRERMDELRRDRDLWARRAHLLATSMAREAAEIGADIASPDVAAGETRKPSRSEPSVRVVA